MVRVVIDVRPQREFEGKAEPGRGVPNRKSQSEGELQQA